MVACVMASFLGDALATVYYEINLITVFDKFVFWFFEPFWEWIQLWLIIECIVDVPIPVDLVVERQLLNSLLISWSASQSPATSHSPIQSYSVYVNGLLKASVKANDRTKALLEKVDLSRVG